MQVGTESFESDAGWTQALAGGDEASLLQWIDGLQRASQPTAARQALDQAHARLPQSREIARALLEVLLRYRSWRRMEEVLDVALKAHPRDGDLRFLAACALEGQEQWLPAAVAFELSEALLPQESEPLLRRARALRVAGRPREAMRALSVGLERLPDAAPVHAALGYACIDAGEHAQAVQAFERAVALDPDWPTYLDDLAGALMLCERWQDAARAAVRSLERRKKNERAWTVYAISHQRLGDDERAEQGYRNALRAAREPTRAKGNFGLFLSRKPARVLEAARHLREAHEAHPEWEEVERRLAELRGQGDAG